MSISLDEQISEARKRAEAFSLTLEQARKEELESMEAIEHERLKWAESYDDKVVMIEQLQRELAYTVEALHVEKSIDINHNKSDIGHSLSNSYDRDGDCDGHSHGHGTRDGTRDGRRDGARDGRRDVVQDESEIFESTFSSNSRIYSGHSNYTERNTPSAEYHSHHSEHRNQLQQLQREFPPPPPPNTRQYDQTHERGSESGAHKLNDFHDYHDSHHTDERSTLSLPTRSVDPSYHQYTGGKRSPGNRGRTPSDGSDTTNNRLVDTLHRKVATLQDRVDTLVRRENDACQEQVSLRLKLEEVTSAWRDSEGKLRFKTHQAQEWDTEREARDKIESDLRSQLAKYEAIVEANDLKHSHCETQRQHLTEQIRILEQKNTILLEENKKHVRDFEHFKAQLEFHKSVANANNVHHSDRNSTTHITHISNHQSLHNSTHTVVDHVHEDQKDVRPQQIMMKSDDSVRSGGRAGDGVAQSSRELSEKGQFPTPPHIATSSISSDISAASEREINLNKAFQTEEELERWLEEMKRGGSVRGSSESITRHSTIDANARGNNMQYNVDCNSGAELERERNVEDDESSDDSTQSAEDMSVSEAVLQMRESGERRRSEISEISVPSQMDSQTFHGQEEVVQQGHGFDINHHNIHQQHHTYNHYVEYQHEQHNHRTEPMYNQESSPPPTPSQRSNTTSASNRGSVGGAQGDVVRMAPISSVAVKKVVVKQSKSDGLEQDHSQYNSVVTDESNLSPRPIVIGDEQGIIHHGMPEHSDIEDDSMADAALLDRSTDIMLDSPRSSHDGEDHPLSANSSKIVLDYQNLQHDQGVDNGGGGISGFFLPKHSNPVKIKVKQQKTEKSSINKRTKQKMELKTVPKAKVSTKTVGPYKGPKKATVVSTRPPAAPTPTRKPVARLAVTTPVTHKPRIDPSSALTPGQVAAQRRLASNTHKHIHSNATEAALVSKKVKKSSVGNPPTSDRISRKEKVPSKKVKKPTVNIIDRDSIDVTSVRSSLSLQSLSLEKLPSFSSSRPSPNSTSGKLVRRQIVRNVSKYPLQANIRSTVCSSVSTRVKQGKAEGSTWK